jgi:hypothetical protein
MSLLLLFRSGVSAPTGTAEWEQAPASWAATAAESYTATASWVQPAASWQASESDLLTSTASWEQAPASWAATATTAVEPPVVRFPLRVRPQRFTESAFVQPAASWRAEMQHEVQAVAGFGQSQSWQADMDHDPRRVREDELLLVGAL